MTKLILLSRAVAAVTAALGACLLACACPAAAFTPSSKAGSESTPLNLNPAKGAAHASASGSGGASLVRTIVGLAIVIAVIWGLAWILRQVKAGREGGGGSHQSSSGLASVAALTLGSGRSVHLVRAGNDYVLLGSTEHGVAPIHRYTEEQAHDAGLLIAQQPSGRATASAGSRVVAAAGSLVAGSGRVVRRAGTPEQGAMPGDGGFSSEGGYSARGETHAHSPVAGQRPDPMRMPSPSSGLIERLRELTVRR